MKLLITDKEDKKPLVGDAWLRDLIWTLQRIEVPMNKTDQSEMNKMLANCEKLFRTNQTIEAGPQMNLGSSLKKQNARTKPYQLQNCIEEEFNKFFHSRHLQKSKNVEANCLAPPVALRVRKTLLDKKRHWTVEN